LTLGHTGSGSDPVGTPTNSSGCAAGAYHEGETISLSGATADPGWAVGGWTGTDDDGSVLSTNTVTMPSSAHTVEVNYVQPVTVGTYDDPDPGISYVGDWTGLTGLSGFYNGSLHYSSTVGSTAMLAFTGDRVKLVYTKHESRGVVKIEIDGVEVAQLDQYSTTTAFQAEWDSGVLSAGTHVIRLTHLSGAYVDVDALIVSGP